MNRQPRVSIITPFYNVEKFLSSAIESVLNQSYQNWELILIDDGSTDGSTSVAHEYSNTFSTRIRYLRHDNHKNLGSSASRNLGLSVAKGEFIAFLDSDDLWLSEKLAHQIELMGKKPEADMICGSTIYWNSWSDDNREDRLVQIGCMQNQLFPPRLLSAILYPLGNGAAPSMNGVLVRRKITEKIKGFVNEFNWMYGDQAFLSKIYLNASVYVTDECYDKYRQRPGSICGSVQKNGNYHFYRRHFLRWFKAYLTENDIDDQVIRKTLNKNLFKYDHPNYYRALQFQNKVMMRFKSRLKKALKKI